MIAEINLIEEIILKLTERNNDIAGEIFQTNRHQRKTKSKTKMYTGKKQFQNITVLFCQTLLT